MNWTNISIAAVAILGPYLTEAGMSVSKKIGEDFYFWLKNRIDKKKDNDVVVSLSLLEKQPASESRRTLLAESIAKEAELDPNGFGTELGAQIKKVSNSDGEFGQLIGQIIAGKVTVINTMYGDVNM